ncbi:MAG: protein translocase subunit SecD [Candidatus Doudnabacteria bacterium]|nr:protein translocase subunit SecD [Candidatus Doudnabacteria bacterium]
MLKTQIYVKFGVIIILAVVAGFIVADKFDLVRVPWKFPFRLGLDLQGGTHLVYEGNLEKIPSGDRDDAMASVREVIERRVNAFGVTEPVVQVAGNDRLIVELPGIRDVQGAIRQIGLTPFLEFRELDPGYAAPDDPEQIDPGKQFKPTGLSGKQLKKAEIIFDQQTGSPQISLQFNDEGKTLFAELTARNVGKPVAIFLDGAIISAPTVQQEITAGSAVITGNFTIDEAKQLAERLNAGALPVPIRLLEQKTIGPSLGQVSVEKSVLAGLIGFVAVALFMIAFYRWPGLLAVLALCVYVLVTLAIFKLIPVTLTLAGIAGFILSVGMAVDANILIFERTREELRAGLAPERALAEGFRRAWSSIRDSNVSSLITVLILAYFGASLIRGFALTLGIGIVVSMFTAIIVTRTFLQLTNAFRNKRHD